MIATRSLSSTLDRMLSLNRVLDDAFTGSRRVFDGHLWVPALDVTERQDAYLVTVELPGVDPRDVDISFEQNVLTVRGSKASALTAGDNELLEITIPKAQVAQPRKIEVKAVVPAQAA